MVSSIIKSLMMGFALTGPLYATTNSQTNTNTQTYDIAETLHRMGTFTTLDAAIQKSGTLTILKGHGPYTIFAPSDTAFSQLPKARLDTLMNDKLTLRRTILYHTIKGEVLSDKAMTLTEANTLSGDRLRIHSEGQDLYVNDAKVIKADIKAKNGIIHVVDRVLLP